MALIHLCIVWHFSTLGKAIGQFSTLDYFLVNLYLEIVRSCINKIIYIIQYIDLHKFVIIVTNGANIDKIYNDREKYFNYLDQENYIIIINLMEKIYTKETITPSY